MVTAKTERFAFAERNFESIFYKRTKLDLLLYRSLDSLVQLGLIWRRSGPSDSIWSIAATSILKS